MRPDRLQSALETFAIRALGLKELSPSSINLKHLHKEQAVEPVLFIVSPGADPSAELEELAKEIVGQDHYHQVSVTRTWKEETHVHLVQCMHGIYSDLALAILLSIFLQLVLHSPSISVYVLASIQYNHTALFWPTLQMIFNPHLFLIIVLCRWQWVKVRLMLLCIYCVTAPLMGIGSV